MAEYEESTIDTMWKHAYEGLDDKGDSAKGWRR